jgi:DNA-binding Lrp family transcriptional regulator
MEYSIKDITSMLGLHRKKVDLLLQELLNEGFLKYIGHIIKVTDEGILALVSNNMYGYNEDDENFIIVNIDPSEAWDIEEPYVPERFMKKSR